MRELEIPSRTTAGASYVVTVSDNDVSCPCAGFRFRGRCVHARIARAIHDDPEAAALMLLRTLVGERLAAEEGRAAVRQALRVMRTPA